MKLNQRGQTAVEYILMLAVALVLGFTFQKRMEEYFLRNPNSFIAKSLRNFRQQFGNDERYRRFRVFARPRNR